MSYSVTPILLILGSLLAIIIVIIRKFPQLTLLDVESLPEVKQERKKDQVLKKRVEEKAIRKRRERRIRLQPLIAKGRGYVDQMRQYLLAMEKRATQRSAAVFSHEPPENPDEIRRLLQAADMAKEQGELEFAEKKYIEAVRVYPTCQEAYHGLGEVYMLLGQSVEAKETYQFLIQRDPNDDVAFTKLAMIAEEEGNLVEAADWYRQALAAQPKVSARWLRLADILMKQEDTVGALEMIQEAVQLEPENPKYLDRMVEISIIAGNKLLTEEVFEQLKKVNPENQKLVQLKEQIDGMR